jgi:hypothetical protein
VTSIDRTQFADALRARPRGWAARGEAPPPALGGYAWGTIGTKLAESLAARVVGATGTRAPREKGIPGTLPALRAGGAQ